jgi:hypothetical protein
MRLAWNRWLSFFAGIRRFVRNRKQRKAAAAGRRALSRRLSVDRLEGRVVMNAAPITVEDDFQTPVDTAVQFSEDQLTANDTDTDHDALEVVGLRGRPQSGSITPTARSFTRRAADFTAPARSGAHKGDGSRDVLLFSERGRDDGRPNFTRS